MKRKQYCHRNEAKMKYRNPIIKGYSPDPTICRCGEEYYLVNSSFEYFPGLPVYHSKNLANWELVSYCLNRENQLDLYHCNASGGIYAPTLRLHEGTFFLCTTNVSSHGNFIIHTENIRGEWSEPVWVAQDGIDPSLLFDEDNTVYFCTAVFEGERSGIYMSEIDPWTGEIKKEPVRITSGCGGRFAEGPHLYKIGGMYYLMMAEGGTEYGHTETIMRSSSPYGPYEACPHNPILSKVDSMLEDIKCTGHADLMEDHNGNWWLVFLAVRPITDEHRRVLLHNLGRETFLAPVTWENGWPVVNAGAEVMMEMDGPLPQPSDNTYWDFFDDFSKEAGSLEYNYLRNPHMENYVRDTKKQCLTLTGTEVTLNELDTPTMLLVRQREFQADAKVTVTPLRLQNRARIGLAAYYSNDYHYEIYCTEKNGKYRVCLSRRIHDLEAVTAEHELSDTVPVQLRILADKESYRFYYRCVGDDAYTYLGCGDTAGLCTEITRTMSFTGVYFGMFAEAGNGEFREFSVEYKEK